MNKRHNQKEVANRSDKQLAFLNDNETNFESCSHENGGVYWYASDFMQALGYKEFNIVMKPILKATQVCTNTGIDIQEHFVRFENKKNGKAFKDIKLTRFACYLVVMNADIKKQNVANAQAYFAAFTSTIQQYFIEQQDIERINLREHISEHEKSLNSVAKRAGVQNYAFFQNKGYLGLYNMSLSRLKELKGIPNNRTPFDFMGAEELGANIFRVTQTEAKIKRDNIRGQNNLEKTAYNVGEMVRNVLIQNGSDLPENLPPAEDIKHIRSDLKRTNKAFNKQDRTKQIKGE